jgi:ribosomal protection tetracycline resistance protein
MIVQQKITPVFLASAKKGLGILDLLDALVNYLPAPSAIDESLQAIVFKTNHLKGEGKIAAVRIFSGEILSRDFVFNTNKNEKDKVSLIKNTDLQNPQVIQSFSAGEIAWVQGLKSVEPGDFLGFSSQKHSVKKESLSFLLVQIAPVNKSDVNILLEAVYILNNEDPSLNFSFSKEKQELHITIRGKVQEEILQSIIKNRFGIDVVFSEPSVIYKETPTKIAEGYVRYWLPKPCWAIMKFKIEPAERGSGISYFSEISVNDIKQRYQNDIEKAIPFALKQGVLGWHVDDIKITLIEGEDHEVHTKSNDFTIATPMGIMDALSKSESILLEPILSFKIIAPEEFLGTISSELHKIRANINSHIINNGKCKLLGDMPLATSIDFPIRLSSITSGKGKLITHFLSYQACDLALGKTREYDGISPLDTAKYILKARKALG